MNRKFGPDDVDPNSLADDYKGPLLGEKWEGFIEIRMPSYPERLRFPKELGIESVVGTKDEDQQLRENLKQMEFLAKCAEMVQKYIVSVDLKTKDGVEHVTSQEDLYCHPGTQDFVTGLCTRFILGFLDKKKS